VSVGQRITRALFLQCIDVQARPIFSLWFNPVHGCHFSLLLERIIPSRTHVVTIEEDPKTDAKSLLVLAAY
jgi:hypothetical protein